MSGQNHTTRYEFREIPDWDGYGVDTYGDVWSCRVRGSNKLRGPWRRLALRRHREGYLWVKFGGKRRLKVVAVHQLVLTVFVGPKPPNMGACHRDGNPANNRLDNLYWGTQSENLKDAVRHGTHPATAFTIGPEKKQAILALVGSGLSFVEQARRLGVSRHSIARIQKKARCG